MEGPVIRQAKIYDVPAIARIERETSASPWSADALTRDVTSPERAYVAVALIGDERIGYGDVWLVAGEAQLNNIAVDSRYRGMHAGEGLLRHLMEVSRDAGCSVMTLEVRAGNKAALALYDKAGFRCVGVRSRYYRDNGEDAVLMDRYLDALDTDTVTIPQKDEGSADGETGASSIEFEVEII